MANIQLDYLAAGGNRHPSAADWKHGLLAFGAGQNIALWNPEAGSQKGITGLLTGHTDIVNAVKIFDYPESKCIISGGSDNTIRIWTQLSDEPSFEQTQCLSDHQGSINTISTLPDQHLFATGAADGTVKIWDFSNSEAKLVQSISIKPRCLPLTSALIALDDGAIVLAVAGTSNSIQLYVRSTKSSNFELQATLVGHEGWIRSLDFIKGANNDNSDILLASASQDKYIRLWRFTRCQTPSLVTSNGSVDPALAVIKTSLSNKTHQVGSKDHKYSVTFEALLIGHEDWIYTAKWAPKTTADSQLSLLSASADNSIAIWQADESSGVWVCNTRLGEISAQKGSTTATGSTGGFWIGLWQSDSKGIASLGRTGSWRRWRYDSSSDMWQQQVGIGGHTQEIQSLAWAPDGSYLLSTGSDQTTRLFAQWQGDGKSSWHEFARPQIHGYDLNCIDTLSSNQFISGADEKLLRVFNKPKAIDNLLSKLCGIESSVDGDLPDAANIPVLGLSNKAIAAAEGDDDDQEVNVTPQDDDIDPASLVHKSTLALEHPPFEEHLARHTLWPEHEKLYGHGYEISAVAASNDGSLVATACKASSIDHAVIRLYESKGWREVKPPLTAHNLTVTSLAFSQDDKFLLSVGRDRQWFVFSRRDDSDKHVWSLLTSNPKGHARMILDCAWAPPVDAGAVFATAARDKTVKIWKLLNDQVECVTTISATSPITAVAFRDISFRGTLQLALGTEEGVIRLVDISCESLTIKSDVAIGKALLPAKAINSLEWRPTSRQEGDNARGQVLAVASDDCSLRLLTLKP